MRHISIRALMAFVIAFAIGLAAMRDANPAWAMILLLVALGAIDAAVLGAVLMPGRSRAWWAGFAVFSGGYLIPALSHAGLEFPTTRAARYVHSRVNRPPMARPIPLAASPTSPSLAAGTLPPINLWRAAFPGAADLHSFERVGHSLFALLGGLMGGPVGVWFHAWRARRRLMPSRVPGGTARFRRVPIRTPASPSSGVPIKAKVPFRSSFLVKDESVGAAGCPGSASSAPVGCVARAGRPGFAGSPDP